MCLLKVRKLHLKLKTQLWHTALHVETSLSLEAPFPLPSILPPNKAKSNITYLKVIELTEWVPLSALKFTNHSFNHCVQRTLVHLTPPYFCASHRGYRFFQKQTFERSVWSNAITEEGGQLGRDYAIGRMNHQNAMNKRVKFPCSVFPTRPRKKKEGNIRAESSSPCRWKGTKILECSSECVNVKFLSCRERKLLFHLPSLRKGKRRPLREYPWARVRAYVRSLPHNRDGKVTYRKRRKRGTGNYHKEICTDAVWASDFRDGQYRIASSSTKIGKSIYAWPLGKSFKPHFFLLTLVSLSLMLELNYITIHSTLCYRYARRSFIPESEVCVNFLQKHEKNGERKLCWFDFSRCVLDAAGREHKLEEV